MLVLIVGSVLFNFGRSGGETRYLIFEAKGNGAKGKGQTTYVVMNLCRQSDSNVGAR